MSLICTFGSYSDSDLYVRNRVLISALANIGHEVVQARYVPRKKKDAVRRNWSLIVILVAIAGQLRGLAYLFSQRRIVREADVIFVPYPSYINFFFLKYVLLVRQSKPIVVDSFLCLYDTIIDDRKIIQEGSFAARVIRLIESSVLCKCDRILIDTEQNKSRLIELYNLSDSKIFPVPVGLDEKLWAPLEQASFDGQFRVLFWGTFIPLHGVEFIVEAARLMAETDSSVRFKLIGDGQTADHIQDLLNELELKNLVWDREIICTDDLIDEVASSHCILGVFGESRKASSVVPYKVHQALASNRRVITQYSEAYGQTVSDQCGLALIPAGDPLEIKHAILLAKELTTAADAVSTRVLYDRKFSIRQITRVLNEVFDV